MQSSSQSNKKVVIHRSLSALSAVPSDVWVIYELSTRVRWSLDFIKTLGFRCLYVSNQDVSAMPKLQANQLC
jgi:hypothetical protein